MENIFGSTTQSNMNSLNLSIKFCSNNINFVANRINYFIFKTLKIICFIITINIITKKFLYYINISYFFNFFQ